MIAEFVMQLESFLERSASAFPDKTALIVGSERLTYVDLDLRANRLAHALLRSGVTRGDRVAVFLPSSSLAVVAIFAALKAGAVFLPVNPTTKKKKLRYILADCNAKALVTTEQLLRSLEGGGITAAEAPSLKCTVVERRMDQESNAGSGDTRVLIDYGSVIQDDGCPGEPPPGGASEQDLASLIYTSGSTGAPKGVMLTHRNMVSATDSINAYIKNVYDDVIGGVLPLSFDYGLYQCFLAFQVGATLLLEKSFAYPVRTLETFSREGVTGFPIVPTIAALLLQLDLQQHDLGALRYITNTGAALPTSAIERIRKVLPRVEIISMYGLTECKRVSYLPPSEIDRRPDSVGKAMPNVDVWIEDKSGDRVATGEIGQLVVRGPNVMKGYWGLAEETDKCLGVDPATGYRVLYTGDLFRQDDDGYLYFVARQDEVIKTKGQKVSPREVEEVVLTLDGVVEAAVCGVEDDVLGQRVTAFVVLGKDVMLEASDVIAHCRRNLEDFMVPGRVEIRDALPKTDSGKVSKAQLKVKGS